MRLAVESGREKPVFLPREPRALHTFFYELQKEFGKHLKVLRYPHFATAGAFPHSEDVSNALSLLYMSGAISHVTNAASSTELMIRMKEDTEELFDKEIELFFAEDPAHGKYFDALVKRFKSIVIAPQSLRLVATV